MDKAEIKAIIYIRTYGEESARYDETESFLLAESEKRGYSVVGVCRDTSAPGKNKKILNGILSQIKDNRVNTIISEDTNSITHSRRRMLKFLKQLQNCGGKIICLGYGLKYYLLTTGMESELRIRAEKKKLSVPWIDA